MVHIIRKGSVAGQSHFEDAAQPQLSDFESFTVQNPLLERMRPSRERSKIARFFIQFFRFLAQYFIPTRPDIMKEKLPWIIRAGGADTHLPAHLSFGQLWSYYSRFLQSDNQCHPQLKTAFNRLESDEEAIMSLNHRKRKLPQIDANTSANERQKIIKAQNKLEAEGNKFILSNQNEILKMKEGATRLLMLDRSQSRDGFINGNLFCVISKQQGHYTLRFVGTGQIMSELHHQGRTIPLAGKEKVMQELCFENVPPAELQARDCLKNMLTAWSKSEEISSQTLLDQTSHLAAYKKELSSIHELTTCSDRVDRLFWNVVGAASPVKVRGNALPTHVQAVAERQRIKLRAHVLSLYDLYEGMSETLKPHTADYQILSQVFEGVSKRVLQASQKGYLSATELNQLTGELGHIEKVLQDAKKTPVSIPSKLSTSQQRLEGVFLRDFRITEREPLPDSNLAELGHRTDGVKPSEEPIALPNLETLPTFLYDQIQTKEEFLQIFRELCEKANQPNVAQKEKDLLVKEALRFFHEIPREIFNNEEKNMDSFWWNFTEGEAHEVMDQITLLTNLFTAEKDFSTVTQYEFESLMWMTNDVIFLHALLTGDYISDWSSIEILEHLYSTNLYFERQYYRIQATPNQQQATTKNLYESYSHNKRVEKFFRKLSGGERRGTDNASNLPISFKLGESYDRDAPVIEIGAELVKRPLAQTNAIAPLFRHTSSNFSSAAYTNFTKDVDPNKWVRPINNRYLMALYRQLVSAPIHPNVMPQQKSLHAEGLTSPEAFYDNPEGIFNFFLEHDKNKERVQSTDETPLDELFTTDEMKRLLLLMRDVNPHVQLLAFMQESPHLMRNPEVRNFFDALFFHSRLWETLKPDFSRHFNYGIIPHQIDNEIHRLEELIENTLNSVVQDEELLKGRLDTLLYYYEMKEHVHGIYADLKLPMNGFTPSAEGIAKIKQQCLDHKALHGSLPYACRIQTKIQLTEQVTDIPLFFSNYAIIRGTTAEAANIDPCFEEELERHWQYIVTECEAENPQLRSFFDHLCYEKDLPLSGNEWQKETDGTYTNSQYRINLRTLEVTTEGQEGVIEFVPETITNDPLFIAALGEQEQWRATKSEAGNKTIYSLQDGTGRAVQVEKGPDQLAIYKKFGGRWLQHIPKDIVNPTKQIEEINLSERPSLKTLLNAYHNMAKAAKEISKTRLPFFDHGVYFDPAHPTSVFTLDKEGEIAFKIDFKETKEGLAIDLITDYHSIPPVQFNQFTTGDQIDCDAFDQLGLFENRAKIMVLADRGEIKKIEFSSYGLSFINEGGRLVCENSDLKGYSIDLGATLQERKKLPHSLLLTHADPTKAKKLLVADASAIGIVHQEAMPTGKGIAILVLIFEMFKRLYNAYMHGIPLKKELLLTSRINADKSSLSFTTFDIRPYTGEICKKEDQLSYLELVKQSLKTDKPALAAKMMKLINIDARTLDQTLLKALTKFIQTTHRSGSAAEAALKIKLALQIKRCLKSQKKLKKELKAALNTMIMEQGKILIVSHSQLPGEVQLNHGEYIKLARLYQKNDPSYYDRHMKIGFIRGEAAFDILQPAQGVDTLGELRAAWKSTRPPVEIETQIEELEDLVDPMMPLSEEELAYSIPLAPGGGVPLLKFEAADQSLLFKTQEHILPEIDLTSFPAHTTCEREALKNYQSHIDKYKEDELGHPSHTLKIDKNAMHRFMQKKLMPQQIEYEEKVKQLRCQVEEFVRGAANIPEQLAIFASDQAVASMEELRIALVQNRLEDLKQSGRLPSTLEINRLHLMLTDYFDALSRRNAAAAAIKQLDEIMYKGDPQNAEEWQSMSDSLFRLLTAKRTYDASADPRLLVFEAQQFINFKRLGSGLDQLDLLNDLVKNPHGVIQAPTGAGKTSVLSVMRSLLKADGKTLVIQKVLPALLSQTYDQFRSILGNLFGTAIYILKFDLKRRLTTQETIIVVNAEGKEEEKKIEHSIFKEMYRDLLQTMQNRGCVLTDYKSTPMLEEMLFKVGQTLLESKIQNAEPSPIMVEHFTYLRKINHLIKNKAVEDMDEFDQPNRPIHKFQLDLGIGSHVLPAFFIDESLKIYDLLAEDQELGLLKNIQSDLPEETRHGVIYRCASRFAHSVDLQAHNAGLEKPLLDYFLGINENVLMSIESLAPELKDRITLYKDQFSIYLPLSLCYKEGARYQRSHDGSRTLPCYNGEKHDAKFGTIVEQINYTIQDYLQQGITAYDLKPWTTELKKQYDETADGPAKAAILAQFNAIVPNLTPFELLRKLKSETETEPLIYFINQDQTKIKYFLKLRLQKIKSSGALISMDPQNVIDMPAAVSGISATMGAPESLHRQFQVDDDRNGQIQANMIYRLKRRAEQDEVIQYDPENPAEMLQQVGDHKLHALIDGSGAFADAQDGAELIKRFNEGLEQVGYHNDEEKLAFIGEATGDLNKTGFFFKMSQTRGTDIPLPRDAKAILTLNAKDGMREYAQKEGRLRLEMQRYHLAMPVYQQIESVAEEMGHAICQDALADAQDIFRKSKQELHAILRAGMKKRLLENETISDFLDLFQIEEWHNQFITKPEASYDEPGSYFAARKHIQVENVAPVDVLNTLKAEIIQKAQRLGLNETVEQLEAIHYSPELLAKMPEKVAPSGAAQDQLEMELQIEQEEESELESDLELESHTEIEKLKSDIKPLGTYPMRMRSEDTHSVAHKIHPAYNTKIEVTDAFLPFSRDETQSLHKRKPFDENMYRVGEVYIKISSRYMSTTIEKIVIEDPLIDWHSYSSNFVYDIRTNQVVALKDSSYEVSPQEVMQQPEFISAIAQIKFFDGRTNDYNPEELAALTEWLRANDPEEMRNHLLNQILKHRLKEKQAFTTSQLHTLFESLISNSV